MRKSLVAVAALMALLAGAVAGVAAQDDSGLVTEQVEPGVERIISDGAGHDLEERHPTYRYDMDGVFVAPDGTVWLSTSYRETDNDANPGGGLVWALGQPETAQFPAGHFCFRGAVVDDEYNADAPGVTCFDAATETETRYLTREHINALAAAPDGTFWAVGSHGGSNGGLYHIVPE